MHATEVWNAGSLKAGLARLGLLPLSALYALGWETYLALYQLGIKRAAEPHRPVVCVGNLVVGGAGKSPLTLHIAETLLDMGREVVVGCSGYGSPHAEAAALAPDGPLSPKEWGDEPAMIRWLLPRVPLVVGRRRVLAAELVHRAHPNAVLLMDDGFQHLPLRKHVNLVLDEPHPRNRWCLPAGPYREPRWNRRRADTVLPGKFRVVAEPLTFVNPKGEESPAPIAYALLCALGQPDRFVNTVSHEIGKEPSATHLLGDHDPLDAGTLLQRLPTDRPTIVTAKDWVKLRERPDVESRPFLIARHSVRVEPAAEFREWLGAKLDER